jgi:periplasmic divalent cation tolerance protein
MTVLLCHCTCPDVETANSIARTLVEERLAACVTVQPGVISVYRWQGAVEHAQEVLLVAKTTRRRLAALHERIRTLHPYDLPELLAFEATDASPAYLAWVEAETGPLPDG